MTKKKQSIPRRRPTTAQDQARQTNWLLIGAVVAGGGLILAGLMWLAWRPQSARAFTLAGYCAENEGNCMTLGSETAPVTLVEVSDYGCGHCKNFNLNTAPEIEEAYISAGQVRWLIVPYALGPQTQPAAVAAMCAADQDAFQPFHKAMFEIQETELALTRAGFVDTAMRLELDVDQFSECIDNNQYASVVQANGQAARQVGVNSTPTFFINGVELRGAHPFTEFQQRINRLLN